MDYVHRTNLIPDPRFQHVDRLKSSGVTVQAVDHEDGRRYVRAVWDGVVTDSYLNIAHDIITVPGSYRLHFNAFAQGGTGIVRVYTRNAGTTSYGNPVLNVNVGDGQTVKKASDPFTLKTVTIVRITPPKTEGGLIMITECNLELASTYDDGLPYFDWATMPREAGGGVFVLALSLLVLSALSGGWRHERADANTQLVPESVSGGQRREAELREVHRTVLDESASVESRGHQRERRVRAMADQWPAGRGIVDCLGFGHEQSERRTEPSDTGVQFFVEPDPGALRRSEHGQESGRRVHGAVGRDRAVQAVLACRGREVHDLPAYHHHRIVHLGASERSGPLEPTVRVQADADKSELAALELGVVA